MVPARDGREAPGVHQQQVGDQRGHGQDVRVDHPSGQHRRHAQDPDGGQADQVQRIDPRQPRPQELAVVEAAVLGGGQIDVAEDEAREDEEHLHAQIALGNDRGGEGDVQPRPEGEQHHPGRGEEAEGGEGLQMLGLHDGHVSKWRRGSTLRVCEQTMRQTGCSKFAHRTIAGVSPIGALAGIQPWPVNTGLSRPLGDP